MSPWCNKLTEEPSRPQHKRTSSHPSRQSDQPGRVLLGPTELLEELERLEIEDTPPASPTAVSGPSAAAPLAEALTAEERAAKARKEEYFTRLGYSNTVTTRGKERVNQLSQANPFDRALCKLLHNWLNNQLTTRDGVKHVNWHEVQESQGLLITTDKKCGEAFPYLSYEAKMMQEHLEATQRKAIILNWYCGNHEDNSMKYMLRQLLLQALQRVHRKDLPTEPMPTHTIELRDALMSWIRFHLEPEKHVYLILDNVTYYDDVLDSKGGLLFESVLRGLDELIRSSARYWAHVKVLLTGENSKYREFAEIQEYAIPNSIVDAAVAKARPKVGATDACTGGFSSGWCCGAGLVMVLHEGWGG